MSNRLDLHADAVVFLNGFVTIESEVDVPEFWIELGPSVGWGRFERLEEIKTKDEALFVLCGVRSAHEPVPSPIASPLGVLWRRRAAIEAQRRISTYRRRADQIG
ncbi:hypothetical protein [Caballeronia pedi]|uniref:hypothetical protein n=1 Tax=Caballeronia pedi TaxID=1777141 RepID=UPI0011787619|nr:hypothetical protein [Caballeronia pedi]